MNLGYWTVFSRLGAGFQYTLSRKRSVSTMQRLICAVVILAGALAAAGEVFTGVNSPNTAADFTLTVPAGATNLSLTVPGTSTTYSWVFMRKGAPPTDTLYDFSSRTDGKPNAIYLEQPELSSGTWYVRVRTPQGSQTHSFSLTSEWNLPDLRTADKPVSKALGLPAVNGWSLNGVWQFFRVELTTTTMWRLAVDSAVSSPDVYVQKGQLPTTLSYYGNKRSVSQTNDSLAFGLTEGTVGVYYIGVLGVGGPTGGTRYTLKTEKIVPINLGWDPGLTHAGTVGHTNMTGEAGDYYFRVTTANPAVGAWRVALRLFATNDASLYLSRGVLPSPPLADFKAEKVGSKGLVLALTTHFQPNEEWFVLVRARAGAQWSLVSGEPFVMNLGAVSQEASNTGGPCEIGPEGMRFFRASATAEMLAWRLWLNGATNSILLKTNRVPLPNVSSGIDLSQAGQMLVVPPYLNVRQYFIGIPGAPGSMIDLDSRQQPIIDIAYGERDTRTVTGYGYTTYRVIVPANEIAWQLQMPAPVGNPDLALRRNTVPNESNNDALSDLTNTIPDNLTIVPPALSDGTFYITVYKSNYLATNICTYALENGPAPVTDIAYTGRVVNDDPNRAGWRFFRITDVNRQLTSLGWDLFLENFTPGTRIALRRNMAPGIWSYKNPGAGQVKYYDSLSTRHFLQSPDQQADIWYVGVYNPTNALGAFVLNTAELQPAPLQENTPLTRSSLLPGRWDFYRFELRPEDLEGLDPVLGWDLRLIDVLSGTPGLVIRRERLPTSLTSSFSPAIAPAWPSGGQWAADKDWTKRSFSADGKTNEDRRILAMGVNHPLVPATYYIGIQDPTGTNAAAYTLLSRWVGANRTIPVQSLAWRGGRATNSLAPREAAYYRVEIPAETRSWKVRLAATSGEAMLVVSTNRVPTVDSDKRMQKIGNEHYVLLPAASKDFINPGTYYLTVVSEGQDPVSTTRIGANLTTYTLESIGPMPEVDLGPLNGTDILATTSLEGGESAAFHFHPAPTVLGFWISLEDKQGNPWSVSRPTLALADPGAGGTADPYGNEGGATGLLVASSQFTTVADPLSDETIMIKARGSGMNYADAAVTVHVKEIIPEYVPFDGGAYDIVNRPPEYQFFAYVDVPANALGWDLRLTNVVSGGPQLVICRDYLPVDNKTVGLGSDPYASKVWPGGARLAVGSDWTGRDLNPDDSSSRGTVVALGLGRPLQPGRYYIGVVGTDGEPVSCTLVSRGIGDGFSIPVRELQFSGGQERILSLPAREAAYFKVSVPQGASSWKVQLSATSGESMLIALKSSIPNVGGTIKSSSTNSGGRYMQKIGDEQFLLLPPGGQGSLSGGTYYLAVVSEGDGALDKSHVGEFPSSATLTSFGEAPVTYLGQAGSADLVETNSLSGGEVRLYRFSVPAGLRTLQARLENRIGNPVLALKAGSWPPDPGAASTPLLADPYGNEGGEPPGGDVKATFLPVVNPVQGEYTIAVKARGSGEAASQTITNAVYTLRISTSDTLDLDFEGSASIAGQGPAASRYFKVEVPTNAFGWDIRLSNVVSGLPKLVVRRESLPTGLANSSGWSAPGTSTKWPTNSQWAPVQDWTRRSLSAAGTNEDGRLLAMGLNRPLEPGIYYVGVSNCSPTVAASYNIISRGIGDAFSIPVIDLPYVGAVTNYGLPPREAAYYRVVVPSNSPSWKLKLTGLRGECMLTGLRGYLPNFNTAADSGGRLETGKTMDRAGNEHFVLLPTLPAPLSCTTNYFAVISQGINPGTGTSGRLGDGDVDYVISSLGPLNVLDLGLVTSEDLVQPDTLEGGETKAYRFTVPPGTYGVRVLLENRAGNPAAVARAGDRLPDPGAGVSVLSADNYGNEGGFAPQDGHTSILTISNPDIGVYTLAVKARQFANSYSDAKYTLRVQEILTPDLNFASDFNTNGLSNSVSGLLQDNERAFFRVDIPAELNGQPVIGWLLKLSQSSGSAQMRVRRDALPSDLDSANEMRLVSDSAVIAPPFLTNGTWYVEVKGNGSTAFTLTSLPLALERSAWLMPSVSGEGTDLALGLQAPIFGDTSVDTNGLPQNEGGVLLEQGSFHYYAVLVPQDNYGLLRAELRAISGNPDLYLRLGAVPTLSHNLTGAAGSIYDRSMLAASETEFANWVPLDGKTEKRLKPGLWFMAVRASGNSNARYRLTVSTGNVTELALNGVSLENQFIYANDWRYYRLQMPTALPLSFTVRFSREYGDVMLHLRDTIPPGNGISGGLNDIKDWRNDQKNAGPYATYTAAGTYTFNTPPIRPGQTFYLGFRGVSQANISLSVSADTGPAQEPAVVDFYTGHALTNIEPYSAALFRIDVPTEATRWRHFSTHTTNLLVYIEQGTTPTPSGYDWRSPANNGINSSYSSPLVIWNDARKVYVQNNWPWVAGESYYMLVTNVSAATQSFELLMDGRNADLSMDNPYVDDNDNNSLPDVWELYYFSRTGQLKTADPDQDGVSNLDEFKEGTNPASRSDYRPRLATFAQNGTVERSLNLPSYTLGETVQLWGIADAGYAFVGWGGDASGTANPLTVTLDTHKNITALFKGAGDDFATAFQLSGPVALAAASNVGFTKEPGEPSHAGNPGGKSVWWRWTAPESGNVTISTAGSTFTTLLAVYTGSAVNALSPVASDVNSLGGTNRSHVSFQADAGASYAIAVDGYNGASARIALALTMSGVATPARLGAVSRLPSGEAQFTLNGPPDQAYRIEYSSDTTTWFPLTQVTTSADGTSLVTDSTAASAAMRFYRAVKE